MIFALAIALLFSVGIDAHRSQENCKAKQKEPWSHGGNNGPRNWYLRYPECDGDEQSPIRINPDDVQHADAPTLGFEGYFTPIKGTIKNDGHAIQIDPKDGVKRGIVVDNTFYDFQQMHFHFGSRPDIGSEHVLPDEGFVMELHVVHANERNELAVIGIFFKEVMQNNNNLDALIREVERVRYYGDKEELESPFNFSALSLKCPDTYYRYDGSLTTPPCSENVKWIVMREYHTIGHQQMYAFRSQHSTKKSEPKLEQCWLQDNFRPVQSKNDRVVTLYNNNCASD